MRHAALISELEGCVADHGIRVVLFTAPRGSGLSATLRAFAEEVRGRGERADVIDCERVGVQEGGVVDALLRSRLGLEPATSGQALLAALDSTIPGLDPLAREFMAFALLLSRDDFQTARLDARSRWEGALAEVGRFLGTTSGAWAWIFDDAVAADQESLRLVEQLAQGTGTPGLVVLGVREDERGLLEPRLRLLRSSGRLKELTLPTMPSDALKAAFPTTAFAAKGSVLTAQLLQLIGREGGAPLSAEAVVRSMLPQLPARESTVLSVLSLCGGRLPLMALDAVLNGPQLEVVRSLEAKLLVRSGATFRCEGGLEAWLRFPTISPPLVELGLSRTWLRSLGLWAEKAVISESSVALRRMALPLAIRAAEAVGDGTLISMAWELSARLGSNTAFALRKAESGALGVRRWVMGRMLAEDELFRGEVQRSLATATAVGRHPTSGSINLPQAWLQVVSKEAVDELEQWHRLSPEEAQLSLELVRAEGVAQLGQAVETRRAFEGLITRLRRLPASSASAALWLRMARTWAWFAAEVLSDGGLARSICTLVREVVPAPTLASSFHAMAFLRAEQVAHSRGGDAQRARVLADELIALSRTRGEPREECVGWNARGLLHLRDGELAQGRSAFERSLGLARTIGFRRREAVALHNLGLVQAASGELQASLSSQERYLAVSEQIGNQLARAYGPAAQALVYVHQLESAKAELHLSRARRAAEENNWPGLVAWTRHLAGLLKLLRHLEKRDTLLLSLARSDFLASLDLVEDRRGGWSEELDPAETASWLALTWLCAGNARQAEAVLPRAQRFASGSAPSLHTVRALEAVLQGRAPTASVAWFNSTGHRLAADLWTRLSTQLGLVGLEQGAAAPA